MKLSCMWQVRVLCICLLISLFTSTEGKAQACGSTVPAYTIDMTGHPDSVWTSPNVSRSGLCCSASGSDRCIVFYVTLDTLAAAVKMDVVGGLGSTSYQVNCSTAVSLGATTCISGGGLIKITVCKPGGNAQQYTVTSIPKGYITANTVYISQTCSANLTVHNLVSSSITWAAINSSYNSSLSCTSGCSSTTVTFNSSFPSYVDYKVCGTPVSACAGTSFCDTIRVYFVQDLDVSLTPSSDSICSGSSSTVNIKAVATGGKRPYGYSWTGTTDTDSSIDVGAGTYIVTVTDAALCHVAKDTVVVSTLPLPTPSISGSTSVCPGSTQTYSVTAVSGHSYSWSATNGTINGSSTSNSVSVTWGTTGTTSISVTETNNSSGCVKTDSKSITYLSPPGPSITGTTTKCAGSSQTYSVTAVSGHSYSWSVTNGTIVGSSTGNSVSVTWGSSSSGSISVTQTNNSTGCTGTDSKSITIQPLPAPSISGTANPCVQSTITYSVPSVSGHSYSWSVTNGTIVGSSTSNTLSVTWPSSAGSGNVSITQTNNSTGCVGTDSKSITIQPLPTPSITGLSTVCEAASYTYSTPSVSGSTYSWSASNGTIIGSPTSNSVSVEWNSPGSGSVSVTETSTYGCSKTTSKSATISAAPSTTPIQH